ncbi:MAG: fasciclin domain-containing protein [Bacteroidota bacterium]|nr:fasciclin domain-containing protein [Bacteroidota bacterium]
MLKKVLNPFASLLLILTLASSVFISCQDQYSYDNEEPSWLGSNIYDYLKSRGDFNYTLKLIKDLNYTETMQLTGSITLFVSDDAAYEAFFKNNSWGVRSYDDLTYAQKKMLLKYSYIKNAYVTDQLANYYYGGVFSEGLAMRRETALSALDTIAFKRGDNLPSTDYWKSYQSKGLYLMEDATNKPLVFYSDPFFIRNNINAEDFSILTNGLTRTTGDFHVFDNKVVEKDIVCKNGYVNVLSSVLIPPSNMAQYIENKSTTKIFAKLMDRFCAPYFDKTNTDLMHELNVSFYDSVFVKHYFSAVGGKTITPNGKSITNQLPYDPGWNLYAAASIYPDMAAMFVPTDQAMMSYFNSGVGEILKNRFGSWDNIPDDIIIPFLKRHMRTSLIESVPSRFSKMVDAENYRLPVTSSEIEDAYTAVNGLVYTTNNVYPPVDYISVYSPILLSDNSKIFNWAINITETASDGKTTFAFYKLYLNSLVSKYSVFVPTDEYFTNYLDPIAWGQDVPAALKYAYDNETKAVKAYVYKYDKTTGQAGTLIDSIKTQSFLKNRLWDLLDSHIVVGDVESGEKYYVTKGNDLIQVNGTGTSMVVKGGYDKANNTSCSVTKVFRQSNGSTYFLDKPIQPALKTVYKVLSETPEFSEFFALLNGIPDTCTSQIFKKQGVDFRVNFFNAYRYTIYVPTNTAIEDAISHGIITPWDQIYAMTDTKAQSAAINKMIRFLRYHFQDDAVFFGQTVNDVYQSATIKLDGEYSYWNTSKNKYYKLGVVGDASSMKLTTEQNKQVNVDNSKGLVNIIAKDYIFDKKISEYKNADGTGSGTSLFNTSAITTSASAVIHQIDNVLTFQ